jgi:FkbM family methyltransferase
MQILTRLRDALGHPRVVATGEAAGLHLVAHRADPDFARGTYERPLQSFIAGHLTESDVFYDIGANIGFFSLIAARRVGPNGRVYAFEPVPENAAAISRSARLNGFEAVDVFNVAVGSANGRTELMLARHIGGATLASVGPPPDLRGTIDVEIVTVDRLIAQRGLRPPTLVKVDVEGAELDALKGMAETLRTHRPTVLYEVDDASRSGLLRKAASLAAFWDAAGYALTALPSAYQGIDWHVAHMVARAKAAQ